MLTARYTCDCTPFQGQISAGVISIFHMARQVSLLAIIPPSSCWNPPDCGIRRPRGPERGADRCAARSTRITLPTLATTPQFAMFFADGVGFGMEMMQALDAAHAQDIARAQHPKLRLSAIQAEPVDGRERHKRLAAMGSALRICNHSCHRHDLTCAR